MTEEALPLATVHAPPQRLAEVSRLATLLAGQVLNAQIMKRPVADDHVRSLLDAGVLLREYGIELPSLLGQIMLAAEGQEANVSPQAV